MTRLFYAAVLCGLTALSVGCSGEKPKESSDGKPPVSPPPPPTRPGASNAPGDITPRAAQ